MNILKAYEMFMQEQKFRGNSVYTLEYYERTLKMFLDFCSPDMDIEDLDIMIFKSYQLHLFESRKINKISVRTYARAVKVFYRWLYFEEYIDIDINRLNLMKANKEVILPLTDVEVKNLLALYDNTTILNCRNRTVIMLMLDCGLRLAEVVNLKCSDIDMNNRYIIVNGKGSKQRVVPFGSSLHAQLSAYYNYRSNITVVFDSLFLTQRNAPITNNTIKMLFARIKKKKGFSRIYPHLLRHTFATRCVEAKIDIKTLSEILGHSSVTITMNRYVHPSLELKRETMEQLADFISVK